MSEFGKNLKYIEIEGSIENMGEYSVAPSMFRPYEAVTVLDDDGVEVHFHILSIPKRLDDQLPRNRRIKMRILRSAHKGQLSGVLYAFQDGASRVYHDEEARHLLKIFARSSRRRGVLLQYPALYAIFFAGVSGVGIFAFGGVFSLIGAGSLGALAGGIAAAYYCALPIIAGDRYARLDLLDADISAAGFSKASASLKY